MVWAELKLGKEVDWRTLKFAPGIHIPTERDIPWGILKFPEGRLSIRTQVDKADPYETSNSSLDNNSDGSQPFKLSNNPVAIASRRLRMKKRGHDDEQLPPLHPPHLHVVPHVPGASNTAGTSNMLGPSIIVGVSNIAGANDTACASNAAGARGMLLALTLQGARNMAGAHASAGVDNNPGASGSAGANQPFPTTYLGNPHNNLRILEIRANMDAFGTPPLPKTALSGSNTVAMWRR
jgi:hypothetical protein